MAKIEIYTTKTCPYCVNAKNLLKEKNINDFKEIDVSDDQKLREEMTIRAGGKRSVPQIFINDKHIGGFDDMKALNDKNQLDKILI